MLRPSLSAARRSLCLMGLGLMMTGPHAAAAPVKRDSGNPFFEIREYFQSRLPAGWWAKEPTRQRDRFAITVNVPDNWRGNPTSAVMQFCPEVSHDLWRLTPGITIQPVRKDRSWAGFECVAPLWARARAFNPATSGDMRE